jgi:predicted nucleic acid-binding protein
VKLLDTDVLIEHLRGNARATTLVVSAIETAEAACSVLTRFEVLAGMRSHEQHEIRALLDVFTNWPVTEDIANRAGEWARKFRSSHAHVGAVDYLIAATAERFGAELITRNVKHYPMFPGLSPAV